MLHKEEEEEEDASLVSLISAEFSNLGNAIQKLDIRELAAY